MSAALAAAQVLPALVGAILGVFPGGFALFAAINAITGGDSDRATLPRSGSCSPWCWQPCSWWRRSPLFRPASAAAVR